MVKDLLCPLTNKWDLEKVRSILPQYEDIILRIKTSSTQAPDSMIWLLEKSGDYSTRTGYGKAMTADKPMATINEPVNWLKDIWNVKTSPKIKDFLWRVIKRAIPVSSNLERRGFPSFACKSCGTHEDDIHAFLKCPIAEEVWSLVPIAKRPTNSVSSLAELIKQGNHYIPLPPTGLNAPLWPWVVWNLWKARNKLVFENRVFTAQEIVLKSIKEAKEWNEAQMGEKAPSSSSSTNHPHCTEGVPPLINQSGMLVCNVDAAWDAKTGGCGIGGVFSGDNTRNLSTVSEAHNHVTSALMAEAIAVHRAVSTAVYSNVRSLVVLSDSLSLVKLLKKRGTQPELFGIMFDIYHFVSYFDVISFNFVSRNFNVEADSVAKSALAMSVTNSNVGG